MTDLFKLLPIITPYAKRKKYFKVIIWVVSADKGTCYQAWYLNLIPIFEIHMEELVSQLLQVVFGLHTCHVLLVCPHTCACICIHTYKINK